MSRSSMPMYRAIKLGLDNKEVGRGKRTLK